MDNAVTSGRVTGFLAFLAQQSGYLIKWNWPPYKVSLGLVAIDLTQVVQLLFGFDTATRLDVLP